MTEQTDRKWKTMQLMGFFACVAAVVMVFVEGEAWKVAGIMVTLLGLLVFCFGRILAWWYHGRRGRGQRAWLKPNTAESVSVKRLAS